MAMIRSVRSQVERPESMATPYSVTMLGACALGVVITSPSTPLCAILTAELYCFSGVSTIHKASRDRNSKAVNVRESGLVGADSVNLYIPFAVEAVDAATNQDLA